MNGYLFVLEQLVETFVETFVCDTGGIDADEILQCSASVPIFYDVKLA